LTDRLIKKRQPRHRFSLTPKYNTDIRRLLATLGEGHILALMTDQHARKNGMMVDFFGIPAATYTSAALLHLVTGTPLCFGYCARTGVMKYRIVAGPPIKVEPTGNKEGDIRRILESIHGQLESAIRDYPEQYLWAHRRWRDTPPPDSHG